MVRVHHRCEYITTSLSVVAGAAAKGWPVFPHGHATTVCTVIIVKGRRFCARFVAGTIDSSTSGPQELSHDPSAIVFLVLSTDDERDCTSFLWLCFMWLFLYICFVFVCHYWSSMSCDVFSAKTEPLVFCLYALLVIHGEFPEKLSSFVPCALPWRIYCMQRATALLVSPSPLSSLLVEI